MAFTQSTFGPVSTRSSSIPGLWVYNTSDTLSETLAAGYFNSKRFQLERGDLVYVNASDASQVIKYNSTTEPQGPLTGGVGGFIARRLSTYTFTTSQASITTDIGETKFAEGVDVVATPFDTGVDGGIRILNDNAVLRVVAEGYLKESGSQTQLVISLKEWTPDKTDINDPGQRETVSTFIVQTSSSNEGTIRFVYSDVSVKAGSVYVFVGQIATASSVTLESDTILGNPVDAINITLLTDLI